jgi:hypothetical protein
LNAPRGVFLWVKLVEEELLAYEEDGCCGEEDIFDFLRSLPTELERMYELMLNKMQRKADLRSRAELRDGVKMFRLFSSPAVR